MKKVKTLNVLAYTIKGEDIAFGRKNIDHTTEGLQKAVGGYMEAMHISPDYVAIFNEEGRQRGLMPTGTFIIPTDEGRRYEIIAGDFFIVRVGENGDFESLNDLDVKRLMNVTNFVHGSVEFNGVSHGTYMIDLEVLND